MSCVHPKRQRWHSGTLSPHAPAQSRAMSGFGCSLSGDFSSSLFGNGDHSVSMHTPCGGSFHSAQAPYVLVLSWKLSHHTMLSQSLLSPSRVVHFARTYTAHLRHVWAAIFSGRYMWYMAAHCHAGSWWVVGKPMGCKSTVALASTCFKGLSKLQVPIACDCII